MLLETSKGVAAQPTRPFQRLPEAKVEQCRGSSQNLKKTLQSECDGRKTHKRCSTPMPLSTLGSSFVLVSTSRIVCKKLSFVLRRCVCFFVMLSFLLLFVSFFCFFFLRWNQWLICWWNLGLLRKDVDEEIFWSTWKEISCMAIELCKMLCICSSYWMDWWVVIWDCRSLHKFDWWF